MYPTELSKGFHIATDTSKVTPLENGLFIPFESSCHDERFAELRCWLAKYFFDNEYTELDYYILLLRQENKIQEARRIQQKAKLQSIEAWIKRDDAEFRFLDQQHQNHKQEPPCQDK